VDRILCGSQKATDKQLCIDVAVGTDGKASKGQLEDSSGDRVHDSRCLTYGARRQARLERHFTQPERLHRRPMPSPVTRAMSDLDSLYLRSRPTGLSGRSGPEMALRGVPPPPTTPLLQSPVSRYPRLFADLHTNRR
jgi:hypothetical protein